MRKSLLRVLALICAAALVAGGAAYALELRVGNLILVTGGGFSPTTLPKHEDAPIKLHGYAKIGTVDGSRPSPLTQLVLEFDKHGSVETRGLPKCTMAKLVATTTKTARKMCPGAIVGKGYGSVIVELPEQRRIRASTPITIFNGPKRRGNPTVIGHGHLDYPAPTTYLVPIEIQKVHHGRYGFKTVADFPKIVNYYGSPIHGRLAIGRTWKHRGRTLSYANARCADGRLQARGVFTFKDGNSLQGTVFKPCKIASGRR
jgi:hypothetical protein